MAPKTRSEITYTSAKFRVGVKSDSTILVGVRAVYATSDGILQLVDQEDGPVVPFPVVTGQQVNVQAKKFMDASTADCNLLF